MNRLVGSLDHMIDQEKSWNDNMLFANIESALDPSGPRRGRRKA
jgi:hypothetical protein